MGEHEKQAKIFQDRFTLALIAESAKESCPRGDIDAAFSAFLSEIAADKNLKKYLP